MTATPGQGRDSADRANARVAVALAGLTAVMIGASFAAVPFYRWFCSVTGYGGTPRVAEGAAAPHATGGRVFDVRFDTNVFAGLPWAFRPEIGDVRLSTDETVTVTFRVENLSDRATRGRAVFNVTPPLAATYFTKLACFCFTDQVLGPHEVVEAPVTFFVDSAIDRDRNLAGLAGITLSYTYFPAPDDAALAAAPTSRPPPL